LIPKGEQGKSPYKSHENNGIFKNAKYGFLKDERKLDNNKKETPTNNNYLVPGMEKKGYLPSIDKMKKRGTSEEVSSERGGSDNSKFEVRRVPASQGNTKKKAYDLIAVGIIPELEILKQKKEKKDKMIEYAEQVKLLNVLKAPKEIVNQLLPFPQRKRSKETARERAMKFAKQIIRPKLNYIPQVKEPKENFEGENRADMNFPSELEQLERKHRLLQDQILKIKEKE